MENRVENGMLVMHSKFGLGKVVHATDDRLYIVFRDKCERTARVFARAFPGIVLAEEQSDPVLDHLIPLSQVGGDWVLPVDRLSADGAVATFLEQWPSGFSDAAYLESERAQREKSHQLFVESFGNGQLSAMLAEGATDELTSRTKKLVEYADLLSPLEMKALFDVLDLAQGARSYFEALDTLLSVEDDDADADADATGDELEKAFRKYINACAGLPQIGDSHMFSWPNVTLLPFLAQPTRHMFLKPVITRRAANTLAFDLGYDTTPNWPTYSRLLKMGEIWADLTAELEPRDMIDVQSFIYASCGGYDAA